MVDQGQKKLQKTQLWIIEWGCPTVVCSLTVSVESLNFRSRPGGKQSKQKNNFLKKPRIHELTRFGK
jgi:hypothetical protein